jgi:hypothetical protein
LTRRLPPRWRCGATTDFSSSAIDYDHTAARPSTVFSPYSTSAASATGAATVTPTTSSSSKLATEARAGIAVAVVIGVLAIATSANCLISRRRRAALLGAENHPYAPQRHELPAEKHLATELEARNGVLEIDGRRAEASNVTTVSLVQGSSHQIAKIRLQRRWHHHFHTGFQRSLLSELCT